MWNKLNKYEKEKNRSEMFINENELERVWIGNGEVGVLKGSCRSERKG